MHLSYQRLPNHGNKLAIGQGFPKHRLGGVAHAFQNGSIGVEHRAIQVEQRHIALGIQGNKGIGHNELSSFKNDLYSEARPNITIHKPTSKTAKRALHTSCRRRSISMREGPPRTTVHQARTRQGVSRGRGPPDMGADHASHGAGVSTRGGAPISAFS